MSCLRFEAVNGYGFLRSGASWQFALNQQPRHKLARTVSIIGRAPQLPLLCTPAATRLNSQPAFERQKQKPIMMADLTDYPTPQDEQKVGAFCLCCVCFSLFVYVLRPGEIIPVLAYARLGLTSFALAGAAFFASGGPRAVREMAPAGAKLVKILLLLGFVGIVFSLWPGGSFRSWQYGLLVNTALYFFWLPAVRSPSQLRKLVIVLALAAGCLASCRFIGNLAVDSAGRFSAGMSYDPNDMAMVLTTIFPVVVFLFLEGGASAKMLWGTATAGIVFGILATGSRGGLVAFGVACVLLVITTRSAFKTWHRLLVILLAVGLFLSPAADAVKERMESVLSGDDYNLQVGKAEAFGRLMIWSDSVRLIAKYPLTGVGLDCSTVALGQQAGYWKVTHNAFLQVGLELGVPGLVVFLLILRTIWRNCSHSLRVFAREPQLRSLALLAACTRISLVTYMAAAFFLSQAYSIVLPIILVISNGLAYASEQIDDSGDELEYCEEHGTCPPSVGHLTE